MAINLFQRARGGIGNVADIVGQRLRLPEFGVSELIAGGPTRTTGLGTSAQVFTPFTPVPQQQLFTPAPPFTPVPRGQQRRTRTVISPTPTGGGEGGGAPQQSTDGGQPAQNLFEQAPQNPVQEIDFDALIQPALQSLAQAEQAAQASSQADIGQLGTGQESRLGTLGTQRAELERQLGARGRQAQQLAQESESTQRRGFSEIERGLISRFGTGISTGLGATSILGGQALRNITQTRASLQEAMAQIGDARQGITDVFQSETRRIEGETESLKQQVRTKLQQDLVQIGQARGELQARKAELVNAALQNYRSTVAAVNQRNQAFKQKLFLQAQDANTRLEQARIMAQARLASVGQPGFGFSSFGGDTIYRTDKKTGMVEPIGKVTGRGGRLGGLSDLFEPVGLGTLEQEKKEQLPFSEIPLGELQF